ncbi:hypothetical protein KCU99_g269, partial [Aureobasidium melanogenum]
MSATEGLEPRRVVRVLRWVLSEDRRSAVLAASSVEEAMWEEVMSHCSISVFSVDRVGLLEKRSGLVVEGSHVAHKCIDFRLPVVTC